MKDTHKTEKDGLSLLLINQKRVFYHGTATLFDSFDFSKAGKLKDFGMGFYLTTNFAQAQKHATDRASGGKAYVYQYVFTNNANELANMKILELTRNDKKWLDIISRCRLEGYEPEYDIIYDRLADGAHGELGNILAQYHNGDITFNDAVDKIRWNGENGDQYCFKSVAALNLIKKSVVYTLSLQGKRWKMSREMVKLEQG